MVKEKTSGEAYQLWREREEPNDENEYTRSCKSIVKPEELHFKS